jgi:mannose-6-phosphate isomerase
VRSIALLENPIRPYAWGSRTAIARLLGEPSPAPAPQAELWIGAHPSAPSRLEVGGRLVTLAELVERWPEEVLGRAVAARFGARLPFLVKLLAAAEPLSLQAHPDAAQAREGFARENALGIALDDEKRSYRDASHKPELLCALEPFEALRGFRPPAEIRELAQRLGAPRVAALVDAALGREAPLAELFASLWRIEPSRRRALVAEAAEAAADSGDPALRWIAGLHARHPGDPGALAPLLLHHLRLAPEDAIFLPAGEIHTYLGGFGIEVMASSDNVLRGGLTAKFVDVAELLRILRFEPGSTRVLRPEPDANGARVYATPAEEFELCAQRVRPGRGVSVGEPRGVEILLCSRGSLRVESEAGGVALAAGRSGVAPAAAGAYTVQGDGELHRVRVPAAPEPSRVR